MPELTVVCYIIKDDKVLFIVKNSGLNKDKWLGIGGHMQEGESPYETVLREITEETGLKASSIKELKQRGFLTFVNTKSSDEHIHVFTAHYSGYTASVPVSCNEGRLRWIKQKDILNLPLWEGDKEMFRLLFETEDFFSLKLSYDGDKLKDIVHY